MRVNRKSWHYRIAKVYGRGEFYRETDLCSYTRSMALGAFFWCCAVLVGVVVGYWFLLTPGMWVYQCLSEWRIAPMPLEVISVLTIYFIVAAAFLGFIYAAKREAQGKPFFPVPVPEPLREAYRSWKEKYCPLVEIE